MAEELKVDQEAAQALIAQIRDIGYALIPLKAEIMKEGTVSILEKFHRLDAVYNKDYLGTKSYKMSFLDKILLLGFGIIILVPWGYGLYRFFG